MSLLELAFASLVLLVTPGPTNTLLFLAGTERGWRQSLRLVPAELAGYFASVVPLMILGTAALARFPRIEPLVTVIAAIWVAVLAVRLIRPQRPGADRPAVSARLVFTTTLLNPKALIFGLVLLPGPAAVANLGIFAVQVGLVAAGWAAAGAALGRGDGAMLPTLRRSAALWLALLSATLMVRGLTA